MSEAEQIKKSGNDLFGQQRFHEAIIEYEKGLEHVMTNQHKYDAATIKNYLLAFHLNLAMCHLKLKANNKTLYHCNQALSIDPTSSKAHFRLGSVFESTGQLHAALYHYTQAAQIERSKSTYLAVENIKALIAQAESKSTTRPLG